MTYVRDSGSRAIINTDDSYYKTIVAMRNKTDENEKLKRDISSLKDELSEIKNLLQKVINSNG